jgi:acyl-CoA synthetase (NDP forming)
VQGFALQRELCTIVAGSDTRVLGPNCLGIASFSNNAVRIASANIPDTVPAGAVAIISQSGGVSVALMLRGSAQGLGIAHLISVGNELDVSVPELLSRSRDHAAACLREKGANSRRRSL